VSSSDVPFMFLSSASASNSTGLENILPSQAVTKIKVAKFYRGLIDFIEWKIDLFYTTDH
jgi:hypothetical protein